MAGVIISVFGYDRSGILDGLAQVAFEAGCNVTNVTQRILGRCCTTIMIADMSVARQSLAHLQLALSRAGELVGVRVVTQHEEPFASICRP